MTLLCLQKLLLATMVGTIMILPCSLSPPPRPSRRGLVFKGRKRNVERLFVQDGLHGMFYAPPAWAKKKFKVSLNFAEAAIKILRWTVFGTPISGNGRVYVKPFQCAADLGATVAIRILTLANIR